MCVFAFNFFVDSFDNTVSQDATNKVLNCNLWASERERERKKAAANHWLQAHNFYAYITCLCLFLLIDTSQQEWAWIYC